MIKLEAKLEPILRLFRLPVKDLVIHLVVLVEAARIFYYFLRFLAHLFLVSRVFLVDVI